MCSEYLDTFQNFMIAQAKVNRLEALYNPSQYVTQQFISKSNGFGNDRSEELKKQMESVKNENRELKAEVARLTDELRKLEQEVRNSSAQIIEEGESEAMIEAVREQREIFEDLAVKMTKMVGEDQDKFAQMVSLAQLKCEVLEKMRLMNGKETLKSPRAKDLSKISKESHIRELQHTLDNIAIDERRIEGLILQKQHQQLLEGLIDKQEHHQSVTVDYLAKESYELRQALEERTQMVNQLELELSALRTATNTQQITYDKSHFLSNLHSFGRTLDRNQDGATLRGLPTSYGSNTLDERQTLSDITQQANQMNQPSVYNTMSQNEGHFINIYDYEPERQPNILTSDEPISSQKQSSTPTLISQREERNATLKENFNAQQFKSKTTLMRHPSGSQNSTQLVSFRNILQESGERKKQSQGSLAQNSSAKNSSQRVKKTSLQERLQQA